MGKLTIALAFVLAGCSMGYWPKVEGDTGMKYQADVRDCQTATASANVFSVGLVGSVIAASDSKSPQGMAAIDACMAQKGYRVVGKE